MLSIRNPLHLSIKSQIKTKKREKVISSRRWPKETWGDILISVLVFHCCSNKPPQTEQVKPYKFIISQLYMSEVQTSLVGFAAQILIRLKSGCQLAGLLSRYSGKNLLPSSFRLLAIWFLVAVGLRSQFLHGLSACSCPWTPEVSLWSLHISVYISEPATAYWIFLM